VFAADDSVDHLQQVPAVDADVTVARQVVCVDAHLLVKHLRKSKTPAAAYATFRFQLQRAWKDCRMRAK